MSAERSLAGKRILITRAPHQAARLDEALAAKGAEVLRLPAIAIVPPPSFAQLDAALAAIESYRWLVLTSANGAHALGERMGALKIDPQRLAHLQVACVGRTTARATNELGLAVSVVPEEYVAEGVVAALKGKVAGQRVLLVRAVVARDLLPNELRRMGAEVETADAYQTVLPADSVSGVRALFLPGKPLPDAVTFTSSSTVTNFFALLRAAGLDLPRGLRAVSIGPITSRTLREHGWEPAAEAAPSDIPGLVRACETLLAS